MFLLCPEIFSSALLQAAPGPHLPRFPPPLHKSKTEGVKLQSCHFLGDTSSMSVSLAPAFEKWDPPRIGMSPPPPFASHGLAD